MKDPKQTIREQDRRILIWRALMVGTTAWAIWDPESRYLFAWVIFMSAYAIVISHQAVKAGAEPSAKEDES